MTTFPQDYQNKLDIIERNIEAGTYYNGLAIKILQDTSKEVSDLIESRWVSRFDMADVRIRINSLLHQLNNSSKI